MAQTSENSRGPRPTPRADKENILRETPGVLSPAAHKRLAAIATGGVLLTGALVGGVMALSSRQSDGIARVQERAVEVCEAQSDQIEGDMIKEGFTEEVASARAQEVGSQCMRLELAGDPKKVEGR